MAKNALLKNMDQDFIENSAKWYSSDNGFKSDWGNFYNKLQEYRFLSVEKYLKGKTVLEVGIAEGEITRKLIDKPFTEIVCVEASEEFINNFSIKDPRISLINSFIEDFFTEKKFDLILLFHILEHVEDPEKILTKCRELLSPNGVIIITVPNCNSIHRLAAVKMGLLKKKDSLNETDKNVGHKRVYSVGSLKKEITRARLNVNALGGVFLKPLSNKQIEQTWDAKMMDGFYELGKDMPEYAAEIYAVCKK